LCVTSLSDQQMIKFPDCLVVVHASLLMSSSLTIDRPELAAMERLHSNVIRRFNWTMVYAIPSCYLLEYGEHGAAPIRPFNTLVVVDTFVQ
jgi:hypothetical protein